MRRILLVLCLTLPSSPSFGDEFDRPGWYVGLGGGVGASFLSEFVKDATGGLVDLTTTGSMNVRGGYRLTSWLAFEGMYEGIYDIQFTLDGSPRAGLSTHSLLFNTKLIVPTWRTHPYVALGVGAQHGQFSGIAFLEALDTIRWDMTLRVGLGLDAYLTEHWVLNLELAPSLRFTHYDDIPSESTDNVNLSFTGGVQYRF